MFRGPDVVIDANVWIHAVNESHPESEASRKLVFSLSEHEVIIVFDDTSKNQPALETSLIVNEVLGVLGYGSYFQTLVSSLANLGRVRFAPRATGQTKRTCESLLPRNRADQVVLGTACATDSRHLVTNDFADFSTAVRKDIRKGLKVFVDCASECVAA